MRTDRGAAALVLALGAYAELRAQDVVKPIAVDSMPPAVAAPGGLGAVQTTPRELVLTWGAVAGATGFRLYGPVATRPDSTRLLGTIGGNGTRWVVPLAPYQASGARTLQFGIETLGRGGARSERVPFPPVTLQATTPATGAPATVGTVTARASASGAIIVSWGGVAQATGYAILRAVGTEGFRTYCNPCGTATTLVDTTTRAGLAHVYAVTPIGPSLTGVQRVQSNAVTPTGGAVASADSGAVTGGTTPTVTAPPPPTMTQVAPYGMTPTEVQYRLSWRASTGATRYALRRELHCPATSQRMSAVRAIDAPAGATSVALVDAVRAEHVPFACVGRLVNADYSVQATNAAGVSAYVIFPRVTFPIQPSTTAGSGAPTGTATSPPPPVTNPRIVYDGSDMAVLSWTAAPGATQYRIERLIGAGLYTGIATLPGEATGFADNMAGLIKLNPKYRIVALNAAGASPAISF